MDGSTNNTPSLAGSGSLSDQINEPFALKPGETRLFSPTTTSPVPAASSIPLAVGYRNGGGNFFQVKDHAANKTFGRRIELISLRWLTASEV